MTLAVRKRARIALRRQGEARLQSQVTQVGADFALAIVVVELAPLQPKMTDAQIKHAHCVLRRGFRWFGRGQIGSAIPVCEDSRNRMLDAHIADVPRLVEQ